MKKKLVLIFKILLITGGVEAQVSDNLGLCTPLSKDPKCWEDQQRVYFSNLYCDLMGKVNLRISHGNGYGCGESNHQLIKKQNINWANHTIEIETEWLRPFGKIPARYGQCHYYGPIYGGGEIKTIKGEWKVIVDENYVGTYYFNASTEQTSNNEVNYTQTCKILLD